MNIARRTDLRPPLDAREKPLDTRPIAPDAIAVEFVFVDDHAARLVAHPESVGISLVASMAGDPRPVSVLAIHRDEVFGTRKDEDVRVVRVEVLRQPLV